MPYSVLPLGMRLVPEWALLVGAETTKRPVDDATVVGKYLRRVPFL
jgi:hypothetical protein